MRVRHKDTGGSVDASDMLNTTLWVHLWVCAFSSPCVANRMSRIDCCFVVVVVVVDVVVVVVAFVASDGAFTAARLSNGFQLER